MTHVSKNALPAKVRKRIDVQLIDVLTKRWTRSAQTSVLYEILTPVEKDMFAKRVAMIGMIHMKCSTYEISQALRVSSQTVTRFVRQYRKGEFKNIARILDDVYSQSTARDTIEQIISVGLPSYSGMSRSFKTLRRKEREQKKCRANPTH